MQLNWFDANDFCKNMLGRRLAAIETPLQYENLRKFVNSSKLQ